MKLKINDIEYQCILTDFTISECIDDEMILYNQETNKIIVMNTTSTYIYRNLWDLWEKNYDISDVEISNLILSVFEVDEFQKADLIEDVRDILNHFICEGILKVNNDLLNKNKL